MLKAFNLNFYYLKRMKAAKVLIIVLLSLIIFVMGVNKLAEVLTKSTVDTVGVTQEGVGISYTDIAEPEVNSICKSYMSDIAGALILLFIAIFAVIFAHKDDKNGYVKNIVPQLKHKGDMVFARLANIAIYTAFVFVVYFIVNVVMSMILYPEMKFGFSTDFLLILLVQFVLHLAFASFCDFLTTLSRSSAFGITIGVLFSSGFHVMATQLMNVLETAIFGKLTVDFNNALTFTHITKLNIYANSDKMIMGLIVALIHLVLWNGLSYLITSKRDVV